MREQINLPYRCIQIIDVDNPLTGGGAKSFPTLLVWVVCSDLQRLQYEKIW